MSSYNSSHKGDGRGIVYDERYGRGYTHAMWQRVERPLLEDLFARYGGADKTCLDFACGTGRITNLLNGRFGHVTGVDISADMLAVAKAKNPQGDWIEGDIIADQDLIGVYDVITSFRFFPNAEPDLRERAMASLVTHLNPGGIMIVNNHQNENSLLGRLRRLRRDQSRDFLAPDYLPSLFAKYGLVLEQTIGFGFVPVWRESRLIPANMMSSLERCLVSRHWGLGLALNHIHVARLAKGV